MSCLSHRIAARRRRWLAPARAAVAFALAACAPGQSTGERTPPDERRPPTPAEEAFLDTLEQRTFRFFWETANPKNGLVPDRWPTPSFSSIAAVGFGLNAYAIGAERGWITREQARERVLTTLRWFWQAPQGDAPTGMTGHHGFFYHFLDMQTGERYKDVELSTIDTSLLLAGVLLCQQYFDRDDPGETAIRAYADSLYRRVDWRWAQNQPPLVSMGWKPEEGLGSWQWRGLDEAMILYILALGSPTHAIDSTAWDAWTSTYKWGQFYGYAHVGFAPLFGHQYSQLWIDFRGIQDAYMRGKGIDYFENARRAVYAQRAYAVDNPDKWTGYGADFWGLTASDGPGDFRREVNGRTREFFGYAARGADFTVIRDDGTVAPTAVGGSVALAPEITIPMLQAMRRQYGDQLFAQYGFLDAINPTLGTGPATPAGKVIPGVAWVDVDYLGIDQGPIIGMVENLRSELVWKYMRRSPYIIAGLKRAGFRGGWLDAAQARPR